MCDKRNGEGSGLAQNADAADTRRWKKTEKAKEKGVGRIRDC